MDIVLPVLAAIVFKMALEYALERIYLPAPAPKWWFNDMKEREKVNARKMVSFSPWLKNMFAIFAGLWAVEVLLICLFPTVAMSIGFDASIALAVFGIPLPFVLCMMLWMFRWIHYHEETFTYRNALGIKKTFRYEMVTEMTIKKRKLHVIVDGKTIVFPIAFYGTREFASFASDKIHV